MKKLLLLLLLTASFSTFSLSIAPLVPCDGEDFIREELIVQKEENMVVIEMILEDQSLSDAEKAEHLTVIEERILGIDTHLSDLEKNCKQSPEGQFINGKRDGEWIWWDKYNRKIKAGNYVNGSKEGPWFEWLYTGRAYDTIEMNYKNDMLDGKWTYWYSYEGPFKALYGDDEKHLVEAMIAFLKNEHAEILVESQLSDEPKKYESKLSELEEHIQYQERQLTKFEVPRILEEGNYINGKKEGTWTFWYSDNFNEEVIYEDGVLIEK